MKKKLLMTSLAIFLIVSVVSFKNAKPTSGTQLSEWWSPDWRYRIKVEVYSGGFAREDEPVELIIDFASLFSRCGISGTLDTDSIRVIEQSDFPAELLSQFDPTSGEIIWLTGKMDAESSKTYYVYFDILENGPKASPSYYNSMENGGILVLPMGNHISVIYKIGGVEYETVRIDEASGGIKYFKPPFGSPLIEDTVSRLGFQMEGGTFRGGAVSITGGPVRYKMEFHIEPGTPDAPVVFSDYYYTFYYVPNGDEIKTKLNVTWTASQSFIPQIHSGEWPVSIGIQEVNTDILHTAFAATDIDVATLYDIPSAWGPLDGNANSSLQLSDNFWGAYGERGGIGIIPISPDYSNWYVDGYRERNVWNWTAIEKSIVDFIDRGTYNWDFWIYGFDEKRLDLAKNFGNRVDEPITVETYFDRSLASTPGPGHPTITKTLVNHKKFSFFDLEDKFYTVYPDKHKFSVAWFDSGWSYRTQLTFDNSVQSENLIDFPVLVKLTPGNFDYSHCENDGRDIRFVDADDTTELKYQFEQWNYNGDSYIWVKVPQIDGSSATDYIWMYYGNSGAIDGQDVANVWDSNFVGVWHLNETVDNEQTTGSHNDSTSNDNDGTQQGNDETAGKIANGQVFDGNDYINVSGLSAPTDKTFSLWIYANALTSDRYETLIEFTGDSPWFGVAAKYIELYNEHPYSSSRITTGQWYHIAYTSDSGTNTSKIYIDGDENIEPTSDQTANTDTGSGMGIAFISGDEHFRGIIDEVRISNIARSADWIAAQYLSMDDNFITFGPEAAVDKIRIEDKADGTGAEIDTRTIASGESFTAYAISRDASNNFVDNVAVTWSLIDKTEGVVDSDLVPSGDTKRATFTGHVAGTAKIKASHATLGDDTTGTITVTAGAADNIRIEDAADGTGADIDTRTIASGESFTSFAISRDASDNFVDNVAATWSLIDKTGGVVDNDLVPSGDTKSASFTGHVAGTVRIKASHSTLSDDTTGIISVTAGAADKIRIEDAADGTGAEIDTKTIASGESFTAFAISRDASDNFVDNVAVTWSLIDKTGGVVDNDLVSSGDTKSATFTGHAAGTARIKASHATLGNDSTGVITVTTGGATRIVIEDAADGTGTEVDTRSIASGASFTVYAISRDANDSFVGNVAVTWSLTNITGGVVGGDLVAAADNRSATFTGHAGGSARIRAQHATLGDDTSGTFTVTNQPLVALFEFEPKTGFVPLEICFDASSSYDPDGNIVSYEWDFGDGSSDKGINTCHTYISRGEFLVVLKVTDNNGLTDTATAQIKVQALYPPINVSLEREINRSLFKKEAFHTISWSPNSENSSLTIINYRIYRKEAGEGDESYMLLASVSGSTFQYVDDYLDVNEKFIYAITSVESSGHESKKSQLVGN